MAQVEAAQGAASRQVHALQVAKGSEKDLLQRRQDLGVVARSL